MARRGDNIHKRKDGRWEGRYKNGYRSDGKAKYSSVYAYSFTECKKKLICAQTHTKKTFASKESETFAELLLKWLSANQIKIKGSTAAKYLNIIDSHIIPSLGGIKAVDIDSSTVNAFLKKKMETGNIKNCGPLSSSYVRTMAIIIEAAIKYGATLGLCAPLNTPINKPIIPRKELSVLNRSTETALTELLLHDFSKPALGTLIALQAGLRIGEVCALKWCDVDFENNVIHVRHTVSRILTSDGAQKTALVVDTPKTTASFRDVPMPSTLKKVLLEAAKKKESEYILSNNQSFVGTRTFDYQYRRLLKKYNIEIFSFHTLRHTYATRCAEIGIDAKTISRLLGHSSPNVSLNVYVHPSMEIATHYIEQIYNSEFGQLYGQKQVKVPL